MAIIKLENATNILHFKILEDLEEVVIIYTNNIIPESIFYQNVTYIVTQIGDNIHPVNGTLSELTIPSSVIIINNNAFNSNLTKLFFISSDDVYIRNNTFPQISPGTPSSPKILFIKNNIFPTGNSFDHGVWNSLDVEFVDSNDTLTITSELENNYAVVASVNTQPSNNTLIIPNYIIKDYGNLTINDYVLQNRKTFIPVRKISTNFLNQSITFTITTIYIPYNITTIESTAFNNYQNLTSIYFSGVPYDVKPDSFFNMNPSTIAYFYRTLYLSSFWNNLSVRPRLFNSTSYVKVTLNNTIPEIDLSNEYITTSSIVPTAKPKENIFVIKEQKQDGIFKTDDNKVVFEKNKLFGSKNDSEIIDTIIKTIGTNYKYDTKIDGEILYVTVTQKENFSNLLEQFVEIKYIVFIFNTPSANDNINKLLNLDVNKINKEIDRNKKTNKNINKLIIILIIVLIILIILGIIYKFF